MWVRVVGEMGGGGRGCESPVKLSICPPVIIYSGVISCVYGCGWNEEGAETKGRLWGI